MRTTITSTAISTSPDVHSSIAHASAAATECLERAGVSPDKVDILINTGVYRDSNMAEPAMAALIQRNVGMNLDYVKFPSSVPSFSFDLANGACGTLNAVQVVSAFLASGSAKYALVVAGDAHPANEPAPDFPYASAGAAMLLQRSVNDAGFGRVHTAGSADASVGVVGYIDLPNVGVHGRERITVRTDGDYPQRLTEFAATQAHGFAEAEGIDLARTLLVTSQPTPAFGPDLARRLGIGAEAAVAAAGIDGDAHSAALVLAYHQAVASGQAAGYDQALFVAAGAGLSVACAVYRLDNLG